MQLWPQYHYLPVISLHIRWMFSPARTIRLDYAIVRVYWVTEVCTSCIRVYTRHSCHQLFCTPLSYLLQSKWNCSKIQTYTAPITLPSTTRHQSTYHQALFYTQDECSQNRAVVSTWSKHEQAHAQLHSVLGTGALSLAPPSPQQQAVSIHTPLNRMTNCVHILSISYQ